jgi:hypothetical protein
VVGGSLCIALLSPDRSDVPALPGGVLIGVWDVVVPPGFSFSTVDLKVRYDHSMAADLGLSESELVILRYSGGAWTDITSGRDAVTNVLMADELTELSTFAVGVAPPVCRGDTNCDWQVDFDDINPFVIAIVSGIYCDGTGANADVNGDGRADFDDIVPFTILLTQNPLPILCP